MPDPPGRSGPDPAMRNGDTMEFLTVWGLENDTLRERGWSPPAFPGVGGLAPVGV